jgi:hypothetical protein
MNIEFAIMISIGFLSIFMPRQITSALAKIEWFFWKILLNEKGKDFKGYFQDRNPLYNRTLGVILLFASLIGVAFSIFHS